MIVSKLIVFRIMLAILLIHYDKNIGSRDWGILNHLLTFLSALYQKGQTVEKGNANPPFFGLLGQNLIFFFRRGSQVVGASVIKVLPLIDYFVVQFDKNSTQDTWVISVASLARGINNGRYL